MTRNMAMVFILGLMEEHIKVNGEMASNTGKVNTYSQQVKIGTASGKKAKGSDGKMKTSLSNEINKLYTYKIN